MSPPIAAIATIEPVEAVGPVQMSDLPGAPATKSSGMEPAQPGTQAELNQAILQTSIDVSINSGNGPLALLLQSAIAGINDILEPEFGKDAIQHASSADNTPEATAERIVSLSTGFFAAFQQQQGGAADADVLERFMTVIRSGFEQGYQEARDILQGMQVLDGEIAGNLDRTYELVLQGYADFAVAQGKRCV